jgi:hypothetical protein
LVVHCHGGLDPSKTAAQNACAWSMMASPPCLSGSKVKLNFFCYFNLISTC